MLSRQFPTLNFGLAHYGSWPFNCSLFFTDSLSTAHTVLDVSAYDDHSAVTSFLANAYVLLHLMFCSFMFVFFPGWCSISIITTSVYSSLHLMSSVSISLWTSISVVVVIIIWFVTISSEVTSQDIMFYEQKKGKDRY